MHARATVKFADDGPAPAPIGDRAPDVGGVVVHHDGRAHDRARQAGLRPHRQRARPRTARARRVRAVGIARVRDRPPRRPLRPAPDRGDRHHARVDLRARARGVRRHQPDLDAADLPPGDRIRHRACVRVPGQPRAPRRHRAREPSALARGAPVDQLAGGGDPRARPRRLPLRRRRAAPLSGRDRPARRRHGRDLARPTHLPCRAGTGELRGGRDRAGARGRRRARRGSRGHAHPPGGSA